MRDYIFIAIIAYLCGSIPFGYLLVRLFKGKDIRESGSGNIGATNVARTAPGLGIATLLLDLLKGYLAVEFAIQWMGLSDSYATGQFSLWAPWAALFVVLGHMFPAWLKFRGGKGVATAMGGFIAIAPGAVLVAVLIFLTVVVFTRYISLGSIIAAAVFPALVDWLRPGTIGWNFVQKRWPSLIPVILISFLIIAKHHANIRRLLNRTENRFGEKKAAQQVAAED